MKIGCKGWGVVVELSSCMIITHLCPLVFLMQKVIFAQNGNFSHNIRTKNGSCVMTCRAMAKLRLCKGRGRSLFSSIKQNGLYPVCIAQFWVVQTFLDRYSWPTNYSKVGFANVFSSITVMYAQHEITFV